MYYSLSCFRRGGSLQADGEVSLLNVIYHTFCLQSKRFMCKAHFIFHSRRLLNYCLQHHIKQHGKILEYCAGEHKEVPY